MSLIIICLSMKFLGVIMFGIYSVPWIWKTGEIFSYHFFEYIFSLMGFFWDYGGNIRLYSLVFHRLWGWCVHIFSVYFFSLWHKFFLIYIEVHKSSPLACLILWVISFTMVSPVLNMYVVLHCVVLSSWAVLLHSFTSSVLIRHVLAGIWEARSCNASNLATFKLISLIVWLLVVSWISGELVSVIKSIILQ